MTMAIYENQQKVLIFEDHNGMELPILADGDGNGMPDNTGAAGVHNTDNQDNNPYLSNNP